MHPSERGLLAVGAILYGAVTGDVQGAGLDVVGVILMVVGVVRLALRRVRGGCLAVEAWRGLRARWAHGRDVTGTRHSRR